MGQRKFSKRKGASLVASSSRSSARRVNIQSKKPPSTTTDCSEGVRVLFYGLWAFWIQEKPTAQKEVLAFTPDVDGHSYFAASHGCVNPVTLNSAVEYMLTISPVPAPGKLGQNLEAADFGCRLHTTKSPTGWLVNVDDPQKLAAAKVRLVWLPCPDDIIPLAYATPTNKLFSGEHVTNIDLRGNWPMVVVFCYPKGRTVQLSDGSEGILKPRPGKNLHLITAPPLLGDTAMSSHACHAWKCLVRHINARDGNTPLRVNLNPDASVTIIPGKLKGVDPAEFPEKPSRAHMEGAQPSNCVGGGTLIMP